jgi:hypothetical protein
VTARLRRAREGRGDRPIVQDTILQALVKPSTPRVFTHNNCGGWVLFEIGGGRCLECAAFPVPPPEYAKPEAGAA